MTSASRLRDWSLAILGALEPVIGEAAFARGNKAGAGFPRLSRSAGRAPPRKTRQSRSRRADRLIQGEANGERLTAKELLHNCIFLLNAGHETTTNLIGNGLVTLSTAIRTKSSG